MSKLAMAIRIELFLDRASNLRSSSAASSIGSTKITLRFPDATGSIDYTLDAPDDDATVSFFTKIRAFDTPGTDLYVLDFLPTLREGASPARLDLVDWLLQCHAEMALENLDRPSQVLGPGATPRQVWELWTYAHLVHTDDAKRATWAALHTYQQGIAKFIAYSYAGDLFHIITVVEAMLRDRSFDDRGVEMKYFGVAPWAIAKGIAPFRAARVWLRRDEADN